MENSAVKKQPDPHTARQSVPAGGIAPSPYDPDGSYTGRPSDPAERPVQDADDL